jgi:hypothetical protein
MNRIIKVGKQVVLVAVVAGLSAYLAAGFAVKSLDARNTKVQHGMVQLVSDYPPAPCNSGC